MRIPRTRLHLPTAAAAASASTLGCNAVLDPSGAWVPKDPGQIIADTHDGRGHAIADVQTCVEIPNDIGSSFKECTATDRGGRAVFLFVPAGARRVDIKPPQGFAAGADGSAQDVIVVKHEHAHVDFELVRIR